MNEMRLERNEILSLTEWRKSRPNGTRLKQNDTKGMLNETRLQWSDFPKHFSLTHAWLRSLHGTIPISGWNNLSKA
jgi:hypothetical protein